MAERTRGGAVTVVSGRDGHLTLEVRTDGEVKSRGGIETTEQTITGWSWIAVKATDAETGRVEFNVLLPFNGTDTLRNGARLYVEGPFRESWTHRECYPPRARAAWRRWRGFPRAGGGGGSRGYSDG